MKDLIVSVADSYQEKVMEALLQRIPMSSNTREFSFEIIRNILNDSGSYNESHELLRPFNSKFDYSLVLFDYEGSGIEHLKSREAAEIDVELRLTRNGWAERNAVIIIEPELENWMWIDNPRVEDAIGWKSSTTLYNWARSKNFILNHGIKPLRPKESLEEALKLMETSKSSSIYKKIATNVSYRHCVDPAFVKLISALQNWFPIG